MGKQGERVIKQLKISLGPWVSGAMEPGSELSKLCCSCTCSLRDANIWQKGDLKLPSSPRLWGWKFSTVIPRCGFLRSSLRFYLCLQESQWRLVERDGWAPRTCIYCFILYQSAGGKKLLWKGNRQSRKVSDFGKEHSVQRLFHFIKFQLQLFSSPYTGKIQPASQPTFQTFFWLEANCSFAFWEIQRVPKSLKPSLNLDLPFLLIKLPVI